MEVIYRTEDGQEFTDKEAAERHERLRPFVEFCDQSVPPAVRNSISPHSLYVWLTAHWDELSQIMTPHRNSKQERDEFDKWLANDATMRHASGAWENYMWKAWQARARLSQ